MSRPDHRLLEGATIAAALCLLASCLPSTALAQGRAVPSLASLLAACGRTTPAGAGYQLPEWVMRGHVTQPVGPPPPLAPLKARVASLPTGDPARADALMDLGEAYLRRAANQPGQGGAADRSEAIKALAQLARDHRTHQRRDQSLHLLGYTLGVQAALEQDPQRSTMHQQARRVYRELIKNHPTSRFVPHAYTHFADYYFEQGDMDASSRFYERVVQYPPPGNPLYGFATYRRAWCAQNMGDRAVALRHFYEVIVHTSRHPGSPDAAALGRQARSEICVAR